MSRALKEQFQYLISIDRHGVMCMEQSKLAETYSSHGAPQVSLQPPQVADVALAEVSGNRNRT